MDQDIAATAQSFRTDLSQVRTVSELESLRIKYTGRKGLLNELFKIVPTLRDTLKLGAFLNSGLLKRSTIKPRWAGKIIFF